MLTPKEIQEYQSIHQLVFGKNLASNAAQLHGESFVLFIKTHIVDNYEEPNFDDDNI